MRHFVVLCCVAVTLSHSLLEVQADKEAHVSSRMVKKEPKGVVKGHSALIRGKKARCAFYVARPIIVVVHAFQLHA